MRVKNASSESAIFDVLKAKTMRVVDGSLTRLQAVEAFLVRLKRPTERVRPGKASQAAKCRPWRGNGVGLLLLACSQLFSQNPALSFHGPISAITSNGK
jgi:hypothetical protein